MADRDDLANYITNTKGNRYPDLLDYQLADAILAAGWRKPPQFKPDLDAELEQLADIVDSQREAGMRWVENVRGALLDGGWRRVTADEDTVERVAEAIRDDIWQAIPEQPDEFRRVARAAIDAIGGGQ